MGRLFLPPRVAREIAAETQRFAANVDLVVFKDATCREWDRELKRLDPLLEMVKAPDRPVAGLPLVAGAYHVLRRNPGAPVSLIPVRDEEGRPIHPPGRLLEQLKAMDMWQMEGPQMLRRLQDAEAARVEREKVRNREDRQANILDQYKSVTTASISMDRDRPWHQNVAGRRGARKSEG